ncbi:uncharacterized protein LOC110986643 isoform X2 [Acanthaster planci]|uniref:Uncharacterized protein LOC110986643 isoform X2 n=1 Tax=Acanthaster planci TaxID=133434 RepID=A0A8B7ZLZ8_ACAPL|nr:uncharacterized protein LOC110986643 isoform X2 [Acanthaster planci]
MFDPGSPSYVFGHNAQGRRQLSTVRLRASSWSVSGACSRLLVALTTSPGRLNRRHVILGVLYTMVGISLISTFSIWSAVTRGGRNESMIVGRRTTEEQIRNTCGTTNATTNGTCSKQRPLGLKDMAKSLGGLADLFAIQPCNGKCETKKEGKEAPKKAGAKEKSYECPKKAVCPELDIPGLVEKRSLNMQDTPMNVSVIKVMGKDWQRVESAVETGNQEMQKLLGQTARYNTSVRTPITESLSWLGIRLGNYTYLPGGHWTPTNCLPRWKVAIIFPYRNRSYHLPIVLRYLTPMLQRQLLEFAFYSINQENNLAFNRAMLMNVGFVEALNFSRWDCFIFHDVDHLPLSDFNYYGCSGMPRHFLSGADRWKYKLPYANFFGAVTGFTTSNILKINGFPNVYWGWGGEDDEIWERVKEVGLPVSRPKGPHGYYDVIKHHHSSAPALKDRMQLLRNFKPRFRLDGLNNLRYRKPRFEFHALYTNISVDIQKLPVVPHQSPRSQSTKNDRHSKAVIASQNEKRAAAAKRALANGHVKTKLASDVNTNKRDKKPEVNIKPGDRQRPDGAKQANEGLREGDPKRALNASMVKTDQVPAKPQS